MSESGLLRFFIIVSELSVITFIESGFTSYTNWYKYHKIMVTSGTLTDVGRNESLGKILMRLESIYGFSYKELFSYIKMFFEDEETLNYYDFTKHTYKSHIR